MSEPYNRKILIVDDQPELLKVYVKIFAPSHDEKNSDLTSLETDLFGDIKESAQTSKKNKGINFTIVTANQGQKAISLVKNTIAKRDPFAVAFIDVRMPPGIDGVHTASEVRKIDPNLEIVFVTAYSDFSRNKIMELVESGDFFYLRKPFDVEEIRQFAVALSDKWNLYQKLKKTEALLRRQNAELKRSVKQKYSFENIIGNSDEIIDVLKKAEQVSLTDVTVLIYGETGTGKELIAQAIHNNSPRASKNFVAINCGAIPENLLETELFGHEKGAFTNATARRIGRFEEANNGTLFLDEIGDMPLNLQIKLLRVLQEGVIQRLGSNSDISIDVRIIAATHQDLAQLVGEGKFRQDLFYRLKVFELEIPPLCKRKKDIPLFIDHFITFNNKKLNKQILGIEGAANDILCGYDYPGNVRELQHIIERAIILCKEKMIGINDLPQEIRNVKPSVVISLIDEGDFIIPKNNNELKAAKAKVEERIERLFLTGLLSSTLGNVSEAARQAGMNRSWLAQLVIKHHLDLAQFRKGIN